MAIINCPECKNEISDQSQICIHCGYHLHAKEEQAKKEKRKTIWIVIGSIAAAGLILFAVWGANELHTKSLIDKASRSAQAAREAAEDAKRFNDIFDAWKSSHEPD